VFHVLFTLDRRKNLFVLLDTDQPLESVPLREALLVTM
jgi:hypothetical protein